MLDRIELRRRERSGADARIVAEISYITVLLEITLDGTRTRHEIASDRFAPIRELVANAAVSPAPTHIAVGEEIGYEVIVSAGMTQSVFRWIAAAPATWEPIAQMAEALLRLARELASAE